MNDFIITEDGDFLMTEGSDFLIVEDGNPPVGSEFWCAMTGMSGLTGGGEIDGY